MNHGYISTGGSCPNCGEDEGVHGSSAWGHPHMCCSDDCGEELGKKLDDFYHSKAYADLQKAVNKAESTLAKACYKATGVGHYKLIKTWI